MRRGGGQGKDQGHLNLRLLSPKTAIQGLSILAHASTCIWPWPPAGCLLKLPVACWVWFAWACSHWSFCSGWEGVHAALVLTTRLFIKVIGPRLHPSVSSIHESDSQTRATCVPRPIPPSIVPSIHSIPSTGTSSGTSKNPANAHHRPAAPRHSVTDSPKNQKHTALFQGTRTSRLAQPEIRPGHLWRNPYSGAAHFGVDGQETCGMWEPLSHGFVCDSVPLYCSVVWSLMAWRWWPLCLRQSLEAKTPRWNTTGRTLFFLSYFFYTTCEKYTRQTD